MDAVEAYRKKRAERLAARGIKLVRHDADEDDNNQNNGGESGGSHGNTKLPFGLCKRFGIAVEAGWTPKDAWAALAGKGITPDSAFGALKEGKDPGTPDAPSEPKKSTNVAIGPDDYKVTGAKYVEGGGATGKPWVLEGSVPGVRSVVGELTSFETKSEMYRFLKEQGVEEFPDPETGEVVNPKEMEIPKEPVKKFADPVYGGAEYGNLTGSKISWASRGSAPWSLSGKRVEGTGDGSWAPRTIYKKFFTKEDMLYYLKEKGVEEFVDPETGEKINPQEIELPEKVFSDGYTGYKDISIGLRGGRYTIVGTMMDGKKKTLSDFSSLTGAKEWLRNRGAKDEDIRLSPALRKREKERVSWLTSDKKEYFEDGGVRYGDIELTPFYTGGWTLTGEDESGHKRSLHFSTKMGLLQFLKDQGVEKARLEKETINPQDLEIPKPIATIGDVPYMSFSISVDRWGDLVARGVDLDGNSRRIGTKSRRETVQQFIDRLKTTASIGDDAIEISDEDREKIDRMKAEDEERERIRREFEAKAVSIGGRRYAEPKIEKDSDGDYCISGYDSDGRSEMISSYGDLYDMENFADHYGLDINSLVKDDDIRADFERYKEARKDFDTKAVTVGDGKYVGVGVEYSSGEWRVKGRDARGREHIAISATSFPALQGELERFGFNETSFPMDDAAKSRMERAKKAKELVDTGDWFHYGNDRDSAFKDFQITRDTDTNSWVVTCKDMDGKERGIGQPYSSWDAAVSDMADKGITRYKVKDGDKELGMPRYGMHKVMLMKKPGGGYLVYADSKRYGKHAIMYETPKEEDARKWMNDNGVPANAVKTRGMNPNDDVPREHTAKSLDNFDVHRMEKIEGSFLEDLSEKEKQDAADMLTEVFDKGAYRAARGLKHFGDIIETGYKSQIETGTGGSGAAITRSGRISCSQKMYGHSGNLDPGDYEKMGYVAPQDDAEDYADSSHPFYGPMTIEFKKDRLKDRTTYTFGDSLNTDYRMTSAGYAGANPTIEGLSSLRGADELREALKAYRDYKAGKMSYSEMFKKIRRHANNQYIELQFNGPVTADDIAKASWQNERDLKRSFDTMKPDQRKRVLKILKDKDIKLLCRETSDSPFVNAWHYLKKNYPDDIPDGV